MGNLVKSVLIGLLAPAIFAVPLPRSSQIKYTPYPHLPPTNEQVLTIKDKAEAYGMFLELTRWQRIRMGEIKEIKKEILVTRNFNERIRWENKLEQAQWDLKRLRDVRYELARQFERPTIRGVKLDPKFDESKFAGSNLGIAVALKTLRASLTETESDSDKKEIQARIDSLQGEFLKYAKIAYQLELNASKKPIRWNATDNKKTHYK